MSEIDDVRKRTKTWKDVIDNMNKQDWAKALRIAERLSKAGVVPSATERETMLLYLNATEAQLAQPSVPPPTEKEWTGGPTMPEAWTRRKPQDEWRDPDENPTGKPLPKIQAKKGDVLQLQLSKDWTVEGGVLGVDPDKGTLTIWWTHKKGRQEYEWTFMKWTKCKMDDCIVRKDR